MRHNHDIGVTDIHARRLGNGASDGVGRLYQITMGRIYDLLGRTAFTCEAMGLQDDHFVSSAWAVSDARRCRVLGMQLFFFGLWMWRCRVGLDRW